MEKLTKQTVDALKPSKVGVKGSYSIEWDQELRGFGVKVVASGLKTFVVQYRNAQGRSRRIMIGRYGVMTLEEARREAKTVLGRIARGVDPLEEKQAAASDAITVAEVCDWYLAEAEAGRILGRRRRPIKASTLAMDRSRIDVHIRPLLGKRAVSALKLGDIEGAQADIAAGKTSKPRAGSRGGAATGGEGVAARTMSTLHAIFEHGVRLGKIESNPARGVRRLASTPRDRRLSRAEIEKLGTAMRTAAQDGEHPTGLAAIRFFLMTGLRRMEGLALERTWLRDEEGSIRFPDTKSGAQTRVIGRAAVDLLLAQPQSGSRFFFPADWGEGHFVGIVRVLNRVCAMARLDDVTPHTLRHTFASVAGDLGFSELTIAALLGHAARGVTQRYIHIDEALRLAADLIADEMADILDGKGASARPPRRGARQSQEFRETDQGVPQAES
ncbi:MAG: integrase [Rhizobiales bacterium 24-66-13]|jgi:integrase|nr:MAG: integrase [Rhizobiales bacterium 35-66-30]OYZ80141.1 MAG: integrase [Rhizobiales bacterium 24-66-13]OZB08580.1 MAG: integrase [Rhizobiales bacterium 39-66-18]HQS08555.1 site-specific integrase [Xanthobacteraceae bacterium]HQS45582.1 site-specific integrase [Xanthobacteraceae bacterium]